MALESQVLGLSSDFTSCELCIEGKMPYEVIGLQGAHSPPPPPWVVESTVRSDKRHSAHSRQQRNERVFLILRASSPHP